MKSLIIVLSILVILIQYPLWFGKGSWLRVWELSRGIEKAKVEEVKMLDRNIKLKSEVKDLKSGTGAIEERARFDLGLIKDGEIFVQIIEDESKNNVEND